MNFLRRLFGTSPTATKQSRPITRPATSGDYFTKLVHGANLVDGKQTWEHAQESKDNLEVMLQCCDAELETMRQTKLVAAPFYFERAAILLRKTKQFEREIEICERYMNAVQAFYQRIADEQVADVRKGPSFAAIETRLVRARQLLDKANK